MKKLICLLASAALLGACEQKTETVNPPAEKKTENNTTIVNPTTEKTKETVKQTDSIVAPANTEKKTETTTTTTASSPNP